MLHFREQVREASTTTRGRTPAQRTCSSECRPRGSSLRSSSPCNQPTATVDAYNPALGSPYCSPAAATIRTYGSTLASPDSFVLAADQVPGGQFAYFLASIDQGSSIPPGSTGSLCLAGNIGRFDSFLQIIRGPAGWIQVDLTSIPVSPPTWNFQCWHRD